MTIPLKDLSQKDLILDHIFIGHERVYVLLTVSAGTCLELRPCD